MDPLYVVGNRPTVIAMRLCVVGASLTSHLVCVDGRDAAAEAHINECHYDRETTEEQAMKDTYGFCCDRCNCTGTTKCCGRFPNTATIPNQVRETRWP